MTKPKVFDIVVACCDKLGIGCGGELPWKLKKDMQLFRTLTSTAADGKQNAVILGRKTYFSIPEKFRPLKNRINIVLSREDKLELPENVHHAGSFDSALSLISERLSQAVDRVFVLGGSSLYQEAFKSDRLHRIYLTRIYKSIECDVFLPDVHLPNFKRVHDETIASGIQTESGLDFEFQVYQRARESAPHVALQAAMSSDQAIGLGNGLPWPTLPTDHEHYLKNTSSRTKPDTLVANIKGRLTYESSTKEELNRQGVLNLVVSANPASVPDVPSHLVVPSLAEALRLCEENKAVEYVWIMGGGSLYQTALSIPECQTLHLTEIEGEFEADTYFPKFDHIFTLSSEGKTITENNVTYKMNVYQRKVYGMMILHPDSGFLS